MGCKSRQGVLIFVIVHRVVNGGPSAARSEIGGSGVRDGLVVGLCEVRAAEMRGQYPESLAGETASAW